MSLSESIGAAGLSFYAEVALVLFFAVFVAVTIQLMRKHGASSLRELSALPLEGFEESGDCVTAHDSPEALRHGQ